MSSPCVILTSRVNISDFANTLAHLVPRKTWLGFHLDASYLLLWFRIIRCYVLMDCSTLIVLEWFGCCTEYIYWSLFGSVVAGRRFHHCSHFESKLGLDPSGLLSSGFFDVPGVNIIKSGLAS